MYLDHYKLRDLPFALTFDEKFFYESPLHGEALSKMTYAVQQRKGMVLVTGEIGAGKTFVSNMLAARLGPGCTSVLMNHPPRSGKQLLKSLAARLGMDLSEVSDELSLVEQLREHLERLSARGRLVAVVVDEAQELSSRCLEELRLIWNWEHEGRRLVQIVLIGQPELRQRLQEPQWEALRQRIALSCHLGRLSEEQTAAYVDHRLRAAMGNGCTAEFTAEAQAAVHAAAKGIPRLINMLCDSALLSGYMKGRQRIDAEIISEVLQDGACWTVQPAPEQPAGEAEVALGAVRPAGAEGQKPVLVTRCPRCRAGYEVGVSKLGKVAHCRVCGRKFVITAVGHRGAGR